VRIARFPRGGLLQCRLTYPTAPPTVPAPDPASAPRHPLRVLAALGVAQIVSWGSLVYAIGVLAPAMARDLGLSTAGVFGAFSFGMLVSGAAARPVGRRLDRDGGRRWLAAGSVVATLALAALAAAQGPVTYYAAWGLCGVASAMTLYDPAFATLAQHFGTRYRSAVTALTLYGGFASTVFWPLAHYGLDHVGWRATLAGCALLEVALCLPLHLAFVPPGPGRPHGGTGDPAAAAAPPPRRAHPRLAAIALAFGLNAFVAGALAAHMPALLGASGLSPEQAAWAGALFGPMQVAGRVAEMAFLRRVAATRIGVLALGALVPTLALLVAMQLRSWPAAAFAFAALYGLANGVITIVRGTVPAEIFGRDRYGELLGRIAVPSFVARAVAPVGFALAAIPLATSGAAALLLVLAVLSLAAFVLAARVRDPHGNPGA